MSRVITGTPVNVNGVPVGVSTPPTSSFTAPISIQQMLPRAGAPRQMVSQSLGKAADNAPTNGGEALKNSFSGF